MIFRKIILNKRRQDEGGIAINQEELGSNFLFPVQRFDKAILTLLHC